MSELKLYNTLTRKKESFEPEDAANVRMYVCGPTVYDFAHIGNARPVIVFDVLFRLLRHLYGEENVTYVRNITDVDDKINARALRDYPDLPLNEAIRNVTEKTTNQFHEDVKALGCLEPTHEPRATQHIDGMVAMIQTLLDKGHAYVAKGEQGREVLFRVSSMKNYGGLSNRKLEDQQAGARVAVEMHKENASDFVLWKESGATEPGWKGVFGDEMIHGRPGWHIECSVMSKHHLGKTFDIHGGGLDLIFPHHENEIAQSCCAHGTDRMARYWMHNGYLQVEGRKMSKSEGNFVTINELTVVEPGDAIRWLMFKTHYRQPFDFRRAEIRSAATEIRKLIAEASFTSFYGDVELSLDQEFLQFLCDDLNTPAAIARLHELASESNDEARLYIRAGLELLGIRHLDAPNAYMTAIATYKHVPVDVRASAHFWKYSLLNGLQENADHMAAEAAKQGWKYLLKNGDVEFVEIASGTSSTAKIEQLVQERLEALKAKNFAEADRIRDELASQGIQLRDSKDSETGERITSWEVKR